MHDMEYLVVRECIERDTLIEEEFRKEGLVS